MKIFDIMKELRDSDDPKVGFDIIAMEEDFRSSELNIGELIDKYLDPTGATMGE